MWARTVEIMLGVWLVISPFIFRYGPDQTPLWINDAACGVAIIAFGLLSFWSKAKRTHLLTLLVALWMIGFAYVRGGYPAEPGYQNEIIVGLTLLIFAIIPTDVFDPPASWREFYRRRAEARGGPDSPAQ